MSIRSLVLLLLVASLALLVLKYLSTVLASRRARAASHRDKALKSIEKLGDLPGTPLEVLRTAVTLAATVFSRLVPLVILVAWVRAHFSKSENAAMVELQEAGCEVQTAFWEAYMHLVLAVSYRSLILGPLVRRLALPSRRKPPNDHCERDAVVVADIRAFAARHRGELAPAF